MGDNVIGTLISIGGKILIAAVIILVTWLIARGVRWAFGKLVTRLKFLQRTGGDGQTLGESIGKIAALVVWLFGLIAVLQVFSLGQVISPIQAMLQNVMAFLPNLLGAIVVFIVGALLAKVVRQLIETALRAAPLEKWLSKAGVATRFAGDAPLPGTAGAAASGVQGQPHQGQAHQEQAHHEQAHHEQAQHEQAQQSQAQQGPASQGAPYAAQAQGAPPAAQPQGIVGKLPSTIGLVVYALIMIVVAIAALQILGISAISDPASQMLTAIFDSIPRIVAALLLLGLGVLIAKFVGDLLQQVLESVGTDRALAAAHLLPEGSRASVIISRIAQVAVVLFFAVMAAQALAFPQITEILQQVLTLGGQVVFGGVIIAAGFFLGNLIQRVMGSGLATTVIKYVTIVLFAAMGLKAMGIADSIIELGFGAVVVGGALAAALAFGLGGREAASRTLQKLEEKGEELSEAAAPSTPPAPSNPPAPAPGAAPTYDGGTGQPPPMG